MIIILLMLLGVCLGSFVNAFVWRLHEKRNWTTERSECTHCHHVLAPKDLIPVVSWMLLRGKCRYCGKKIQDTPLTELALPLLFLLSYSAWPYGFEAVGIFQFVVWCLLLVIFLTLAVYDLRWFLLPDKLVFTAAGIVFLQLIFQAVYFHQGWGVVLSGLVGAGVISGLFYLLFVLSNGRWIGGGDVKLGLALGMLAGGAVHGFLLLFTASLLGSLCMLPAIIRHKAKANTAIPFGPFLLAAVVIVYLFGTKIVDWYTQLLYI